MTAFGSGSARTAISALAVSLCFLWAAPVWAKKMALVVGNAAYDAILPLDNAVNDARDLSEALLALGFEVTLLTDIDRAPMTETLDRFADEAQTAETVLFYFSGHAFQMDGSNFLVPRDAALSSIDAVATETWALDDIIGKLESRDRPLLVFLDACRNNPLPRSMKEATGRGLARLGAGVGTGTFVAFATQPGEVTLDSVADSDNSPFTHSLLQHIGREGLSISDLMIEVRNETLAVTFDNQEPWDQSSLRQQVYLKPREQKRDAFTESDLALLESLDIETAQTLLATLRGEGFNVAFRLEEVEIEEDEDVVEAPSEPSEPARPAFDVINIPEEYKIPEDMEVVRLAGLQPASGRVVGMGNRSRVLGADIPLTRAFDLGIDVPTEELAGDALAAAVQTELKRLGCYRMAIDGKWGNGSNLAMTRYYIAKEIPATSLKPTNAIHQILRVEDQVVCEGTYAPPAAKNARPKVKVIDAATTPARGGGIRGNEVGGRDENGNESGPKINPWLLGIGTTRG